ncbi:MAG: ASCH domain-containing protein [Propionibacteriales bacterium]|nr:ASCH domain-containing protein [Propionibacteriales bacterium]
MEPIDEDSARELWADYVAAHPEYADEQPPTERFGDSAELANELLGLVLDGPKRATAGLVAEFRDEGEPLPRIGGHWVVADGASVARAVLRSRELRIGPLGSIDDQFAWDEGEGDRSRDYWLDAHRTFFSRSCARIGVEMSDDVEVVFERFDVVWPQPPG